MNLKVKRVDVVIALGGNIGDVELTFQNAIKLFSQHDISDIKSSSIYKNPAVNCINETPDFKNAVILFKTSLKPQELLKITQNIEVNLGRPSKHFSNMSRTIDLDIILYGDEIINLENLIIPHPRAVERLFVIKPLNEIAPNIIFPNTQLTASEHFKILSKNLKGLIMNTKELPVSCNRDCFAGCPMTAEIVENKIVRIKPSKFSPKYLTPCRNGISFTKNLYHKDRITTPLLRTGKRGEGKFKKISWDDAVSLIVTKLAELKKNNQTTSIMKLGGSGSCRGALHNVGILTGRFFDSYGQIVEPVGSFSSAAATFALPYMFGSNLYGFDPMNFNNSKLIILWGANISETRFGGSLENILLECKKNGVEIIAIDPRRTDTVKKLATDWIQIYPGQDMAMMCAVSYELITKNNFNTDFINKYTFGFEDYKNYILGNTDGIPKTPKWAEKQCGVPEDIIVSFTKKYASISPTALIPGLSIQRNIAGEESARGAAVLQALTGNIGISGGTSGGPNTKGLGGIKFPSIGRINQKQHITCPVYEWANFALEGKKRGLPENIKMIYNAGGNYIIQGPDIKKSIEAFQKVDFSVSHESMMTDTAKHCDLILPATMWIERSDVTFTNENYIFYSEKASEPSKDVMDDYDIFTVLSEKLGFKKEFTEGRSKEEWLDYLIKNSEIQEIDKFKKTGVYVGAEQNRAGFDKFRENPKKYPLNTPSGLIEISSQNYATLGFIPYPHYRGVKLDSNYPLRLVTPHSKNRVNSQNANIEHFDSEVYLCVMMNREDAEKRGIKNGDTVEVSTQNGTLRTKANVSDDIMKGVISIPNGNWFTEANGYNSVNALSPSESTLPSHGARTHTIFAEIKLLS